MFMLDSTQTHSGGTEGQAGVAGMEFWVVASAQSNPGKRRYSLDGNIEVLDWAVDERGQLE